MYYFENLFKDLNNVCIEERNLNQTLCRAKCCKSKKKKVKNCDEGAYKEIMERINCLHSTSKYKQFSQKVSDIKNCQHKKKTCIKLNGSKRMDSYDPEIIVEGIVDYMSETMSPEVTCRLIEFLVKECDMNNQEAEDFIYDNKLCEPSKLQHITRSSKHQTKWVGQLSRALSTRTEPYFNSLILSQSKPLVKEMTKEILKGLTNLTGEEINFKHPETKMQQLTVLAATRLGIWIDELVKDLDKPTRTVLYEKEKEEEVDKEDKMEVGEEDTEEKEEPEEEVKLEERKLGTEEKEEPEEEGKLEERKESTEEKEEPEEEVKLEERKLVTEEKEVPEEEKKESEEEGKKDVAEEGKEEEKEDAAEEGKEEGKEDVAEEEKDEEKEVTLEERKEEPTDAAEEGKEEGKEDAAEEGKEEGKEDSAEEGKEEGKEDAVEEGKEEGKQDAAEEVKEEGKEDAAEEVKEEEKEVTLEERKEEPTDAAEEGKEEGKEDATEEGKEEGKEDATEEGKEEGKEDATEEGKEEGKEDAAEEGKEEGKEDAAAEGKEEEKEVTLEERKEEEKEVTLEERKEEPTDAAEEEKGEGKDIAEEEKGEEMVKKEQEKKEEQIEEAKEEEKLEERKLSPEVEEEATEIPKKEYEKEKLTPVQSDISIQSRKESIIDQFSDILGVIKGDIEDTPKCRENERQKYIKDAINKRLEQIIGSDMEKMQIENIEDAASKVACWIEKIMESVEKPKEVVTHKAEPVFAIKQITGSTLAIHKLSSGTVAETTAQARGIESPLKRKMPTSESPLNSRPTDEWFDWVTNKASVSLKWGDWIDSMLTDGERQIADKRKGTLKEHRDWKQWRDQARHEAEKWKAETGKIKDEGKIWDKKLNKE